MLEQPARHSEPPVPGWLVSVRSILLLQHDHFLGHIHQKNDTKCRLSDLVEGQTRTAHDPSVVQLRWPFGKRDKMLG